MAERSILIKNMLEDVGEVTEAIPIPNVYFTFWLPAFIIIPSSSVY